MPGDGGFQLIARDSLVYVVTDNICNPNRQFQSRSMKKQAPHPKQQSFLANRTKIPLQDRQQAHQFMRSFLNIYSTVQSHPDQKNPNNNQSQCAQYPLAYHFLKVPPKKQQPFTLRQKQNLQQGVLHGVDTTLTKEDEESEYQNYLKEYQTVVKNSRKQEYISPVTQKEEMDELITEFLSGMQEHSRIRDRPVQPMRTAEKRKQKKKSQEKSQEEVSIRVEKIDLTNMKSKNDRKSALKSTGQREYKKEVTPIKQINLEEYLTVEVKSPRFAIKNDPKPMQRKSPKKHPENKKIELIKVQDLRDKNSHSRVTPVLSMRQGQKQKKTTNDSSYTNAKSTIEKDSYLKKNLHKTIKNQKNSQEEVAPRTKDQDNHTFSLIESEPHNKKPIKIEIEIPLQEYSLPHSQDRVEEYDVQSHLELHQEETQIIRQISQKVLSLIQKTKHITPQKNA